MSARARWKELCMDTDGDDTLGRFYADVLGLEFRPDDDVVGGLGEGSGGGPGDVVGDVEGKGIAMCRVPEAGTVKNRVHIDVYADSLAELEARGASVVRPAAESGLPWSVLRDPEGGEFCAFLDLTDKAPDYRFFQLVTDAVDAHAIAQWWADVFEARLESHDSSGGWWGVHGVPDLPFTAMTFGQVPEPKTVKNRIHWDLDAHVDDMLAAGATLLREKDDEIRWHVMADPEGNEFCVFEPVI